MPDVYASVVMDSLVFIVLFCILFNKFKYFIILILNYNSTNLGRGIIKKKKKGINREVWTSAESRKMRKRPIGRTGEKI